MAENVPLKILIVDDASFTRLSLRRALEKHGFKILEAGTAEEGMSIFISDSPALVITDLMLPGSSGMKFFEQSLDTRITPFFLITHVSDMKQLDAARTMGFAEVIQKPVDPEKLFTLMQRHLPNVVDPSKQLKETTLWLEQRVVDAAKKGAAGAKMAMDDYLAKVISQALMVDSAPASGTSPAVKTPQHAGAK